MKDSSNSKEIDDQHDWWHQIKSQLIKLDEHRCLIELNINNLAIDNDDFEEIIAYVKTLSKEKQSKLVRKTTQKNLPLETNNKFESKVDITINNRIYRKKSYFRNKIIQFNA